VLSILGFLAVLGPLVVVHEFGHYIFARIFGVKAEIFSIGFGPRLWSRQLGETELRVSAIPLGGYVKLLGEEGERELTPEEQKRALQKQVPWKRFLIFFGGPLFNFIFAVIVFMAILAIGEPQLASTIGRVVTGSPAEKAGFQSGDRITSIDGKPVTRFEEVMSVIADNPLKDLDFEVVHPDSSAPTHLRVAPQPEQGYSVYGETTDVGEIGGIFPMARVPQVGVSNPNSLAGKAGVVSGDKVVSLNGQAVATWEELERRFEQAPAGNLTLKLQNSKQETRELVLSKPSGKASLGDLAGIYSSELFVEKTVPKSPAEGAGIKAGDRLVAIGPQKVQSFFELKDAVQKAGEKEGKINVTWEREGKVITAVLNPTSTTTRDPLLKKSTQFTIGIVPNLVWTEPVTVVERIWNPFMLVIKATERMAVFSWRNIVSIRKMFTGDVSIATLGGPILIGKIAGESLSRGLIAFLTTMAVLSVGLGVLNILPIPVLDGGHLLLVVIEAIRGKPLAIRQMEIVQQVGIALIFLLMVVVMRNDIARLPFFD
jgi:regulator of sigma E protease